jgi:hypothetical protein
VEIALRNARNCPRQPNATYLGVQRWFFNFIARKCMEGILPDGDKFITHENVDLYFIEEVATMLIQP